MGHSRHLSSVRSPRLSRRTVVGSGLAATALWRLGTPPALGARQDGSVDPTTWRTWLLSSVDELRPTAPSDPTSNETDELLDYQSQRTDETATTVAQWGSGPAVIPWVLVGLDLADEFGLSGPRIAWTQALLRTALYDTVLATLDAQAAHTREAPSIADPSLTPMEGVTTDGSSFPSLHAAVAGAASTVLTYLFPDAEAERFETMAEEAATSRLWAGANYPSDVEAGLALGQAVGDLAIARGKSDGSDAKWDGSGRLTGEGYWVPTPPRFVETPVEPLAGTWETWVLPSGDAVRPAPPPEYGSPLWQAELEAVQEATSNRTLEQVRIVQYWDTKGPFGAFTDYALDLIERNRLDDAHTARVLALMSVAQADAVIAVWDAKYTYWTERPITADPDLDMLLPTPPYPSYPSGFSAVAGSAAVVLSHLFPRAEVDLMASAAEAAA
ncbi:MAG TPA: phosphatase PAP2 family protein, partial [Thermomicrobiales bacterium]|nr:phosphatase PAP2 family protein [Thermomicrobiales bacterium]